MTPIRFSLIAVLVGSTAVWAPAGAQAPNTLTPAELAAGWRLLFDGRTMAGWRGFKKTSLPSGWRVVGGAPAPIGIGGSGFAPLLPSHTTGHAGPRPAVR